MHHAMSKNGISSRMIKSEGEMWWSGAPHGKHMVRVRSKQHRKVQKTQRESHRLMIISDRCLT